MPLELLSIHEASRRYGKDRRTIQRKITRGELKRRTLKNGETGLAISDLETVFGPTEGGGMPPPMPLGAPLAAPLATGGRHAARGATPDREIVTARLEVSLAAEQQRYADLEAARQREVSRQNDHIDSLRTELAAANARAEAAHLENQNLHRQLADARRHETERARINPPSPSADIIDEKPDIIPTKLKSKKPDSQYRARNSQSAKAPTVKTKQPTGLWSRWFG